MTVKVFLDTNVWFYAFVTGKTDAEKKKNQIAGQLLKQEASIVLSTRVLNELSVNLLKKANFVEDELQNLISTFYSRYLVTVLGEQTLLLASNLRVKHKISYWDSLIVACAEESGCTKLYTEDMQNGQIVGQNTMICNPFLGR